MMQQQQQRQRGGKVFSANPNSHAINQFQGCVLENIFTLGAFSAAEHPVMVHSAEIASILLAVWSTKL